MKPELLAITPPVGAVEASVLQSWQDAGALERALAVLLRRPGSRLGALADPALFELREACEAASIPLLVSCSADALGGGDLGSLAAFEGVQLRGDPPREAVESVRARLGDRTLGCSCHGAPSPFEVHAAADYVCFAPVFPPRTPSTGLEKTPSGLGQLRAWTADPRRFVVALGGLGQANARACVEAGARGLAGIRSFFGPSDDVLKDVRAMVDALGPIRRD